MADNSLGHFFTVISVTCRIECKYSFCLMCLLVVLYRVKRNLQHFQADVDFVTHIKDREIKKEACREGGALDGQP